MPRKDAFLRTAPYLILLGMYWTLRGYHSFEGDQAYRLPIFLHGNALRLFATDPFVRAFDAFNPHRGYFVLLGILSKALSLSVCLLSLYVLTFALTCLGLSRLARAAWRSTDPAAGVAAVGLLLVAQAGNIGTNQLFEPLLLDRMIAFAFGWLALASFVERPGVVPFAPALCILLAGLVHPSIGLQLGLFLVAATVVQAVLPTDCETKPSLLRSLPLLILATVPGYLLNLQNSSALLQGLPPSEFRLLTAELQSPQHMLPHLWRLPQWLAWCCYPALAFAIFLGRREGRTDPDQLARGRLIQLVAILLVGLACATVGISVVGDLRLTLFQPFRMATVARGLCLVIVAGHLLTLWRSGSVLNRVRAALVLVGFAGDWRLVIVTGFELSMMTADALRERENAPRLQRATRLLSAGFLIWGLVFLSRHDTESGHLSLLAAIGAGLFAHVAIKRREWSWTQRKAAFRVALAWIIPLLALAANLIPETALGQRANVWRQSLVRRCRFLEVPVDDVERLAVWCRTNTPDDAFFVGPPGPKTFRLWSRRSLAFNRAASPYAAAGLADWAARFADHVGLPGSPDLLVREYLRDRHGLEQRYDRLSPADLAALAQRQRAHYVLARTPGPRAKEYARAGLQSVRTEGLYAIYHVEPTAVAERSTSTRR